MITSTELKTESNPKLIIHTLGRFDVIKNEKSLILLSSGSKKIWELYKFMLTHRDNVYTPEALMDQLWYSESYNDPHSTLRKQMHRLRQVLMENNIKESEQTVEYANGYYHWNTLIPMSIDVKHFEQYIQEGDSHKDHSPIKALDCYTHALALYIGDYLPDCTDQHWVFPIRNYYRRLYLKTVLNTVDLLKQKEDFGSIIKLCEKAIQIDLYEESFHIHYMDALLIEGHQKQALSHYEYITGFYYKEMGVKPSNEMRALYKRLLQMHATLHNGGNLIEELEANITYENAFYCEPDVFKSIYELESRRSQRSGANFSIGVLTVGDLKRLTISQINLKTNQLKQHLTEKLRKGDTFSQWNETQFVVLLPGIDSELMKQVFDRVLKNYPNRDSIGIDQITHLSAAPPQPTS